MKTFVVLLSLISFVFGGHDFYHGSHYGVKPEQGDANVVEYPCAQNDRPCARKYLSPIFNCNPIHVDQKSGSYIYDDVKLDVPIANFSFVWRDAKASGFEDFKRETLHINKQTDTLVYAATIKSVKVTSPKSTIYFYRKGKEPVVTEDYINAEYRDVSLTLTVYKYRDGKHAERHLFAYLSNQNNVEIGPKFTPRDPTALKAFVAFQENMDTVTREVFVNEAPEFFLSYLNSLVCDIVP